MTWSIYHGFNLPRDEYGETEDYKLISCECLGGVLFGVVAFICPYFLLFSAALFFFFQALLQFFFSGWWTS